MKTRSAVLELGLAVALVGLAGCATSRIHLSEAQRTALRERAEVSFTRAFYLKPSETNTATAQARLLAPLFILEVRDTHASQDLPAPTNSPKIFFQPGQTTLNGKPHDQMTYWWTYPKRSGPSREKLHAQGLRITLNSAGRPVIWEVLADTSGARLIFVSQSLELQAMREFGAALEGKRFVVERSQADAPEVVVARVIEDGPVTMGPIVYLRAGTRDVTTVICRCMDAQARELAGQQDYDLVPTANAPGHFGKLQAIERRLRLPRSF